MVIETKQVKRGRARRGCREPFIERCQKRNYMTEEDPIEEFSSPGGRSTQAPSPRRSPRPLTAQSTAQSTWPQFLSQNWSYSRLPQLPKGDWDEPKIVASGRAWEPRPVIFVLRNYGLDSATQSEDLPEEGTKAHFRMFRTVEDAARAADEGKHSQQARRYVSWKARPRKARPGRAHLKRVPVRAGLRLTCCL